MDNKKYCSNNPSLPNRYQVSYVASPIILKMCAMYKWEQYPLIFEGLNNIEISMQNVPILKTLTNGFGVDDALNIIPVEATMK